MSRGGIGRAKSGRDCVRSEVSPVYEKLRVTVSR